MGQWQNKIQCTCSQCGTGFSLSPSYIRVKNYCGEECKRRATACKCDTCGKELNIPKSYQKIKNYCSERCREIAKQKHKDRLKCVCEVCGIEYEMKRPEDRNLKHHYCSDDCKALGRLNRTCEYCGKKFYRGKRKKRVYCSIECYEKANSIGVLKKGICKNCGQEFDKVRGRNIFCSNRCSGLYYGKIKSEESRERIEKINEEKRQRKEMITALKKELKELKNRARRIERAEKATKACKCCGIVFRSTSRIYCSDECAKRASNARKDKRIYRNGKPDLSINLKRLYQRDRGFCQICGKHLEFIEDIQSDNYPSIDHIIPIAKGGLHSWDNVQLACRGCNDRKGANGPAPVIIYFKG